MCASEMKTNYAELLKCLISMTTVILPIQNSKYFDCMNKLFNWRCSFSTKLCFSNNGGKHNCTIEGFFFFFGTTEFYDIFTNLKRDLKTKPNESEINIQHIRNDLYVTLLYIFQISCKCIIFS